jgi:hypothetical protein
MTNGTRKYFFFPNVGKEKSSPFFFWNRLCAIEKKNEVQKHFSFSSHSEGETVKIK